MIAPERPARDTASHTPRAGRTGPRAPGGAGLAGRRAYPPKVRHVPPPTVRGGLPARLLSLLVGLFLCALSIVLVLEADLGLSPWDVLHQGISRTTPLSFGVANIAVGVVVVALAWRLGARIGLGTLANATLIGAFIDLLLSLDAVAGLSESGLGERIVLLALGILGFGIGSAFYIGADMGAGPRDSLMLVVAWRLRTRNGVARAGTEVAALAGGVVLGGSVGAGTLAFALLIGPSVELGFFLLGRSPLAVPRPDRSREAIPAPAAAVSSATDPAA